MTDDTDIYYTYATKNELLEIGAKPDTIFEDISELSILMEHKDAPKLNQVELTKEQCLKLIPKGEYCYGHNVLEDGFVARPHCPFWDNMLEFPKHNNGYCHYLKKGDWQLQGFGLIWDSCKECGVNSDEEYEEN